MNTTIRKNWGSFALALLLLIVMLAISMVLSVGIGAVSIKGTDIINIIVHQLFGGEVMEGIKNSTIDIVWSIRLPRVILAALVGMGLSVSGVVMQAIVKNSLADPYILGISSGASLGATLAIALGIGARLGGNYVGLVACGTAFLSSMLVLNIANINGRANAIKLLMAGVAISSIFSAFSSFIVFTSSNREAMKTISFWIMGGLSGAKWQNLILCSIVVIVATLFFVTQYRTLNLMLLGDEVSITLGKDLHRYRQLYLLVCSIVIGFLVYNAGVIGFVGLVIPHIARLFFGTDHKKVLPAAAIIGAVVLVWADVLARSFTSVGEIPVGVVISLVGAPVFLYLLVSKEYGFGGGGQ